MNTLLVIVLILFSIVNVTSFIHLPRVFNHKISNSIDSTSRSLLKFSNNEQQHINYDILTPKMDDEEEEEEEEAPTNTEPVVIEDEPMSIFKEGIKFPTNVNGSDVRVGIIMARWNADVIQGLYKGVNESLIACGVKPSNVFTTFVPGAFEMPITAKFLAASKRVDVVICLGCLIKGDTMHFEYIAQATANGIMQVGLETYVPCIFGVLTVLNKQQAIDRSTGSHNEGLSWGKTAVEMGLARMSALGMGKMKLKDDVTEASKFVTFNATVTPKEQKEKKRTFF
jgi:6,7-dimethyl-8-ribityllumazine synthase